VSSSSSVRARVGEDAFKVVSGGASCPESDLHNPNNPSDTAPAPRHRTPGRSSHASTCDHWTMKVPPLPAAELGHWLVKQIKSEPVGDRFNYGVCDALYRCGLRFDVFTDQDDAEIRRLLERHRQTAYEKPSDSPFRATGLR